MKRQAYTVDEFCNAYRISRTQLYRLRKQGKGPREILIGSRCIRISVEAAEEWRRDREEARGDSSTADGPSP